MGNARYSAWRHWLHCTGGTYGTWLRGDPRGWRSQHHEIHVNGDYRNPPDPAEHEGLWIFSKATLRRQPVVLRTMQQRRTACLTMARNLLERDVELVELCVARTHYHVLARFTPWINGAAAAAFEELKREARRLMGLAKKGSSHALVQARLVEKGGAWGARGLVASVRSRRHQLRVVEYIRRHGESGAAVWSRM